VLKIEWVAEDKPEMKQQTLAMASGFERYTKKTRRTLFLEEMEQVVPWAELCAPGAFRTSSSCPFGRKPPPVRELACYARSMSAHEVKLFEANFNVWKTDRGAGLEESKAFERYVIEQVLKDFDLSNDAIESGDLRPPLMPNWNACAPRSLPSRNRTRRRRIPITTPRPKPETTSLTCS
jgi:hypothetical protein